MPITSTSSWVPTINEILISWGAVDGSLGTLNAVVLTNNYRYIDLNNHRDELVALFTEIENLDNLRQLACAERDIFKAGLRERVTQLRSGMYAFVPVASYYNSMPKLPAFSQNESSFLRALDDAASLWDRVNSDTIAGFTGPLKLVGGYLHETFLTDIAALRASFYSVTKAESEAQRARQMRDDLFNQIYPRLKQYRDAVVAKFPAGSPFIDTLPVLKTTQFSTPNAVVLSGMWDPASQKGKLAWAPSEHNALASYSLRSCIGTKYTTANEFVVAQIDKEEVEYLTLSGLAAAGSSALFRLYVVTNEGNERGSNTVKITRA
ncbi:MAG: hypothetical protein SFY80_11595 [Verrucomicrobiota bacterium]|nr:hypothetical protein [Verrucomicrobiota bacterium]